MTQTENAIRDQLTSRIKMEKGYIKVPNGPGLGFEINTNTLKDDNSTRAIYINKKK